MPKYKTKYLKGLMAGDFEPIYFSEFKDFYNKAKFIEHKHLLFISYITGLRPIEVKSIVKESIGFVGKYITLRIKTAKKGVSRLIYIPLSSDPARSFKSWIKNITFPKEYVFPTFVKVRNIRDKFIYLNNKYGIGRYNDKGELEAFSFYTFRHNILTLLAENGADFLDLQIFKGAKLNKSLYGSATYYIHRSQEKIKKIAKILSKIMKN